MRQARPSDAHAVALLMRQAAMTGFALQGLDEIDEAEVAHDLAEGLGLRIVVERGDQVTGFLTIVPGETMALSRTGDLQLIVDQEVRGRGIGAELMRNALAWADGGALDRLEVFVRATNQRAISLYKRFGFVEEGVLRQRIRLADGTRVDDIVFARQCPP